jgi:hypothetical protein
VSDVPFEDTHPNPEQLDPPETYIRPEDCRNCGPFGRCEFHASTGDPAEVPDTLTTEQGAADCRRCGPFGPCDVHMPPPHDCDAESCHGISDTNGPCGGCCSCLGGCVYDGPEHPLPADYRREQLRQMTRDAEPYADRVDVFGPPRTETPSPAEAHKIMQQVTGNPTPITPGEVAEHVTREIRDQLAGARLPVPPFPGAAEALRARLRERPLFRPPVFAASEEAQAALSHAIEQHRQTEARRTELSLSASLKAMGVQAGDAVVLDLRTTGDVPVTVTMLMEQRHFDRFPELTALVGEAMKALADTVQIAVLTLQAQVDENGEMPRG